MLQIATADSFPSRDHGPSKDANELASINENTLEIKRQLLEHLKRQYQFENSAPPFQQFDPNAGGREARNGEPNAPGGREARNGEPNGAIGSNSGANGGENGANGGTNGGSGGHRASIGFHSASTPPEDHGDVTTDGDAGVVVTGQNRRDDGPPDRTASAVVASFESDASVQTAPPVGGAVGGGGAAVPAAAAFSPQLVPREQQILKPLKPLKPVAVVNPGPLGGAAAPTPGADEHVQKGTTSPTSRFPKAGGANGVGRFSSPVLSSPPLSAQKKSSPFSAQRTLSPPPQQRLLKADVALDYKHAHQQHKPPYNPALDPAKNGMFLSAARGLDVEQKFKETTAKFEQMRKGMEAGRKVLSRDVSPERAMAVLQRGLESPRGLERRELSVEVVMVGGKWDRGTQWRWPRE